MNGSIALILTLAMQICSQHHPVTPGPYEKGYEQCTPIVAEYKAYQAAEAKRLQRQAQIDYERDQREQLKADQATLVEAETELRKLDLLAQETAAKGNALLKQHR